MNSLCNMNLFEMFPYHILDCKFPHGEFHGIWSYVYFLGSSTQYWYHTIIPEVNWKSLFYTSWVCLISDEYLNFGHSPFMGRLISNFSFLKWEIWENRKKKKVPVAANRTVPNCLCYPWWVTLCLGSAESSWERNPMRHPHRICCSGRNLVVSFYRKPY